MPIRSRTTAHRPRPKPQAPPAAPAPKPAPAAPVHKKRNPVARFLSWAEKNRADYYEDHPGETPISQDLIPARRIVKKTGEFGRENRQNLRDAYGQNDEWIDEFQYGKRRKPQMVKVIIREIPVKAAPRKRTTARPKERIIYVPVPDKRRG